VVVCLLGLVGGWFWWQKRSRLAATQAEANPESHPPARDKDTNGTITTTEAQELGEMPRQRTYHHDDGVECSSWVKHIDQSPPAPVPVPPSKAEDLDTNGGNTNTLTNTPKLEHMFREPTQDKANFPEDVGDSHGA
jgi:hypothetical protein